MLSRAKRTEVCSARGTSRRSRQGESSKSAQGRPSCTIVTIPSVSPRLRPTDVARAASMATNTMAPVMHSPACSSSQRGVSRCGPWSAGSAGAGSVAHDGGPPAGRLPASVFAQPHPVVLAGCSGRSAARRGAEGSQSRAAECGAQGLGLLCCGGWASSHSLCMHSVAAVWAR